MPQTSITTRFDLGVPGMPVDTPIDNISRVQGESSLEMPFGVFTCLVAGVANDNSAKLPAAVGAKLLGLVMFSNEYDPSEIGTVGLKPKSELNIGTKGRFWVISETNVANGDRLFVRFAAGAGGTQLGAIRNAAVTDETIDCTAQGVFRSTGNAGTPVILEIDMTNKP
jgi:hypothetical protein